MVYNINIGFFIEQNNKMEGQYYVVGYYKQDFPLIQGQDPDLGGPDLLLSELLFSCDKC